MCKARVWPPPPPHGPAPLRAGAAPPLPLWQAKRFTDSANRISTARAADLGQPCVLALPGVAVGTLGGGSAAASPAAGSRGSDAGDTDTPVHPLDMVGSVSSGTWWVGGAGCV